MYSLSVHILLFSVCAVWSYVLRHSCTCSPCLVITYRLRGQDSCQSALCPRSSFLFPLLLLAPWGGWINIWFNLFSFCAALASPPSALYLPLVL